MKPAWDVVAKLRQEAFTGLVGNEDNGYKPFNFPENRKFPAKSIILADLKLFNEI